MTSALLVFCLQFSAALGQTHNFYVSPNGSGGGLNYFSASPTHSGAPSSSTPGGSPGNPAFSSDPATNPYPRAAPAPVVQLPTLPPMGMLGNPSGVRDVTPLAQALSPTVRAFYEQVPLAGSWTSSTVENLNRALPAFFSSESDHPDSRYLRRYVNSVGLLQRLPNSPRIFPIYDDMGSIPKTARVVERLAAANQLIFLESRLNAWLATNPTSAQWIARQQSIFDEYHLVNRLLLVSDGEDANYLELKARLSEIIDAAGSFVHGLSTGLGPPDSVPPELVAVLALDPILSAGVVAFTIGKIAFNVITGVTGAMYRDLFHRWETNAEPNARARVLGEAAGHLLSFRMDALQVHSEWSRRVQSGSFANAAFQRFSDAMGRAFQSIQAHGQLVARLHLLGPSTPMPNGLSRQNGWAMVWLAQFTSTQQPILSYSTELSRLQNIPASTGTPTSGSTGELGQQMQALINTQFGSVRPGEMHLWSTGNTRTNTLPTDLSGSIQRFWGSTTWEGPLPRDGTLVRVGAITPGQPSHWSLVTAEPAVVNSITTQFQHSQGLRPQPVISISTSLPVFNGARVYIGGSFDKSNPAIPSNSAFHVILPVEVSDAVSQIIHR